MPVGVEHMLPIWSHSVTYDAILLTLLHHSSMSWRSSFIWHLHHTKHHLFQKSVIWHVTKNIQLLLHNLLNYVSCHTDPGQYFFIFIFCCHLMFRIHLKHLTWNAASLSYSSFKQSYTILCIRIRDAPKRHWPIISLTIGQYRLIQKSLYCCLIKVIYLASNCYPKTLTYLKDCRVQTKQKRTQKLNYKTHPLLPETEATVMFVYFW